MNMIPRLLCGAFAFFVGIVPAWAGVQLDRTRVIIQDGAREGVVGLTNSMRVPVLVHTSIEDLHGNRVEKFDAIPPLYRLEPNKSNRIRLILTDSLPQNKESVFYVNVVCIPSSEVEGSSLKYALGQKIKLFYRPKAITQDSNWVANHLDWSLQKNKLVVKNATNLSISMIYIHIGQQRIDAKMLLPGDEKSYKVQQFISSHAEITFEYIDEYGGVQSQKVRLAQ